MSSVILLTGIQATGKSTVAQLLAEALPHSTHVRGDAFRRMVVGGRSEMVPEQTADEILSRVWTEALVAG